MGPQPSYRLAGPGVPRPDGRPPAPLPPNAPFADGLRSMQIIDAVVRSAAGADDAAVPVPPVSGGAAVSAEGAGRATRARPSRLKTCRGTSSDPSPRENRAVSG